MEFLHLVSTVVLVLGAGVAIRASREPHEGLRRAGVHDWLIDSLAWIDRRLFRH